MPKVALTEEEVVNKIPRFYREEARINELRKMNKALPIIAETKKKQLMVRVDKINPAEILSKRTRVKTNAPSYNSNKTDVIGQEEAKKVVEAVKSGVPILVPRVVKNKQTKTLSLINKGITSANKALLVEHVVQEKEEGNVIRQEKEKESQKHVEEKNTDADVSVKLIKNNFIYVNYLVIFSKSTGSCFQH